MYLFKDPTRLARFAVVAVAAYLALTVLFGLATAYAYLTAPFPDSDPALLAELIGAVNVLMLLACIVIVGMWIYRVSANAHSISDDMTISPGWAVGWYFIPFANLVKPFQAMKEAWLASHYRSGWHGEPTPGLLGWWWGLWLVTNIMGNVAFRLALELPDGPMAGPVVFLNLAGTALDVPLCLILIRIMRELSRTQLHVRHDEVFA